MDVGDLDACWPPFALLEAVHEEAVEVHAYCARLARASRALGEHWSDVESAHS